MVWHRGCKSIYCTTKRDLSPCCETQVPSSWESAAVSNACCKQMIILFVQRKCVLRSYCKNWCSVGGDVRLGLPLLSPLQFEHQDSPAEGFSYRETQLQGVHSTLLPPDKCVWAEMGRWSYRNTPARLSISRQRESVQLFNAGFVFFEGKMWGSCSLKRSLFSCVDITGRADASIAAQPQDMSLLQEPGAIILCLELELSCAMRVHEVLPCDKTWEDLCDLQGLHPSCVLMWSWVPLGLKSQHRWQREYGEWSPRAGGRIQED